MNKVRRKRAGGGLAAVWYTFRVAHRVGWRRLWHAMTSKNACKTCALGMGGQKGGMTNEAGHFPEVCKKSFQAMVADLQPGIPGEFFRTYSIAQLQTLSPRELEWSGRLSTPLYAGPGDTHYRPIEWDDAINRIAEQLRSHTPDESFFYASGRSSNEAGFIFQLLARVYGTNYVNNCSYYCHQASGVGLGRSLGTGTATVDLEDVEHSDLFVLIGGNPASNHPRLMTTLKNIRRRGGKVIVVNPVREVGLVNFRVPSDWRSMLFGTRVASRYIQPHIGGDIALLTGVAKCIIERGQLNKEFIDKHTEGFEEFLNTVRDTAWDAILAGSGVSRAEIEAFADDFICAKNVVIGWTMGITHHQHGVGNVRAIVNLALMRGMVGRPNAGLLPIRGHSNVQGMGTVGVAPQLKQAVLDNLEKALGISLPKQPGLDTMACMEAAHAGRIRTAICLGGNLYGSNPDATFAKDAIAKLDLIAYMNTSLNTGLVHGRAKHTLILPVRARDEESQLTTQESMFNYVRVSDGGPPRLPGPRTEVEILTEIGERLSRPVAPRPDSDSGRGATGLLDWQSLQSHAGIRELMAKVLPGLGDLKNVDATKREFVIPNRVLHEPKFATPSGKAQFAVVPLPALNGSNGELRLMTVRSEGQFNTVVYEDEDIYRGQERRDVVLMHPDDMQRLGLVADQRVTIRSATGEMRSILARPYADIKSGNVLMYYPEANVLVGREVDPDSKTPAFKSVPVTITPDAVVGKEDAEGRRRLATV